MKSRHTVRLMSCVAGAALLANASVVMAQTAPESEEASAGEAEIIVTAQKRSERLQDVPLAVSALGSDALSGSQVSGAAGIATLVPSLNFAQNTSPLNSNVRIRGIGTVLFSPGIESSVSFVIDGVVMARQGQGFGDLIDVERVEVLRGPQGTLFGKNATAGVINVVTKAPASSFEGSVEASIVEQGEYRLRGTVSGPLSENVRARFTGFYTNDRGWAYNAFKKEHTFGTEDIGLRGKIAIDASPNLEFVLTGDYTRSDSTCCQVMPFLNTDTLLQQLRAPVVGSINNRTVNTTTDTFANIRTGGASLEANLKFGDHTLTSISAWRKWDFSNNVDVDGFNVAAPVRTPFGNGYLGINGGDLNIEQVSQEIRLTSPSGGLFEYTLGGMYYKLDLDRTFTRRQAQCTADTSVALGAVCPAPIYTSSSVVGNTKTENIAAFGNVVLNVTDQFSALAGFRIQREKTSYSGTRLATSIFAGDRPLFPASTGSNSFSDGDISGKLGLQYKFSRNAQAYVTWSRGYKGAGWDVDLGTDYAAQRVVRPETVQSWEIGFKGQALDNRLTVGLAAFHAKYDNLQIQASVLLENTVRSFPTNAGSSTSKGIEFEAGFRPVDGLSFNGGVTYMQARVDSDGLPCTVPAQAAPLTVAAGTTPPVNTCFRLGTAPVQNVRNGRLQSSPDWKAVLNARYEANVSDNWLGFVQFDVNYQSRVLFDINQDPELTQAGYATIGASLGAKSEDGKYHITLFAKNLTDKAFALGMQRDILLTNPANPGNINFFTSKAANRYFGGTVRVNF